MTIAMLFAVGIVATDIAQKGGRGTGTTGVPPVASGTTGTTGVPPVENPASDTLRFSAIAVPANGTVELTAAWSNGFLSVGQTLDVLGKENLCDATWTWLTNGVITADAINMSWMLENQSPSNHFYKVVVRDSFTDMDDPDGDGIPNVYELHHCTNPWMPDSALIPKLTVGANGNFATIAAALAVSAPYSVIEIEPGEYDMSSRVVMPPHPVMIAAASPYAIIRSTSDFGVFEVSACQDEETLFRNLYLWLGAKSGFQAGFWCGGNLPWDGYSASATFQNVYVRMPHPGVEYFGWHFNRSSISRAVIDGCVVNAAGATWANGVYGCDPPPLEIVGCSFVNFPTNRMSAKACGVYLQTSAANHGGISDRVTVEISDTLFDASFTNALPLARVEYGTNLCVSARNVLLPSPFADGHGPDRTNGLRLAVADVAWTGHPSVGSEIWSWGLGALAPITDGTLNFDDDDYFDADEAYFRGTDPWLADTDGDGSPDDEEFRHGTDPRNPDSHIVHLNIAVTNRVCSPGVTNYVFTGCVDDWQANVVFRCVDHGGTTNIERFASSGTITLSAFMDLDRNGMYDPDEDIILTKQVQTTSAIVSFRFEFGDVDGDGFDDVAERDAGTDPYSPLSCVVTRKLQIADSDYNSSITNHLWISTSPLTDEAVFHIKFTRMRMFTTNVSERVTNGVLYAIIVRDFNRNGVYDEGVDSIVTRSFSNSGNLLDIAIGDADGDRITDSNELLNGTNPLDITNFKFNAHVFFECMDRVPNLTNYVQTAVDNNCWDDARGQVFAGCVSTNWHVSGVTTGDCFYAMYMRDVNGNGIYDEGIDILDMVKLGHSVNGAPGNGVLIGDRDSDGILDSEELAAGTDPCNRYDCRFDLELNVGGVFATSNNLTAMVLVDGDGVTTPHIVPGRTFTCSLTNLCPSTSAGVVVRFWDDVNQNGVRDAGETCTDQGIVAGGTNTVVYCRLPLGAFDTDQDGMPDYWEVQNGLSPTNPADALGDPDGDGLINLHEFWAGCNIEMDDGANTALYAFCHSIDDKIREREVLPTNVYTNAPPGESPQFGAERNGNCWAYGIDFSGASPWNESEWGLRAGTAISKRHIIFAHHYQIHSGKKIKFIGADNSTNILTILENRSLADTDITIGLLSDDLPESVTPSCILPKDYSRFIGDAKRLPMLFIDNEENARITDSNKLLYQSKDSDGLVPVDEDRLLYFDEVISGDSGGPKYFVCGNSVLLTCALKTYGTGASGRGPFVTYYRKRIQAVMDELCPGYTLREFDLSTFRRLDDED